MLSYARCAKQQQEPGSIPTGHHQSNCATERSDINEALAGLDVAALFRGVLPLQNVESQAQLRLQIMLETQLAGDGGHKEHSPAYHHMLLESVAAAVHGGILDDPRMVSLLGKAAEVAAWLITPSETFAQFGDTEAVRSRSPNYLDLASEGGRFILSRGKAGAPATRQLQSFEESGYAIIRSPQPRSEEEMGTESYLALSAAFHSRAHKHADDLTFIWHHRGHEIVVDSGRFGYLDLLPPDSPDRLRGFYYSRPERQYVESTPAHNTISVDGADIDRRTRVPYGSGLISADQLGPDTFELVAEAPHQTYLHQRRLLFSAGKRLEIRDELRFSAKHTEATAWFNLDGDLDVHIDGACIRIHVPSLRETFFLSSNADEIDIVRGQESPLRGWRSRYDRELEAVWSVRLRKQIEGASTQLLTVFGLANQGPAELG